MSARSVWLGILAGMRDEQESPAQVHVALVQMRATRDVAENLRLIEGEARAAAARGARVVVFPEAAMVNFGPRLDQYAEARDGSFASAVQELATELHVVIVVGMFESAEAGEGPGHDSHVGAAPVEEGKVFNTVLVTGEGIHRGYRKIHLFDSFGTRESETTLPGSTPFVFTVDGVCFGVATCFDLRFPELFYALADAGAHAVIVPTNWGIGDGKAEAFSLLTRARAMDTTMWVLGCGQYGGDRIIPFGVGHSVAVDPLGRVMAELGEDAGQLALTVDVGAVRKAREVLPVLELRRPLGRVSRF